MRKARDSNPRHGNSTHAPNIISSGRIRVGDLDQNALRVISRLTRHGFEAYLVGGCVRDLLLGRAPKDYDVATEAHPRQVKRLFRNGRIIGRRFKLVHVFYADQIIETATFRGDPRPGEEDPEDLLIVEDNVFGTAEEDALRRDFTINGLFLDPTRSRIIDYVGGLEDLDVGLLRTIGDPNVRMAEDPVRILRAVKFATRLGFRIEDGTWEAMCDLTPDLQRASRPRVLEELLRLLRSGTALGAFRMLRACGALAVLLPSVDEYLGVRGESDADAHERADSFWRLLEALDADVHAGNQPSNGLCIAVLFLRIVEREVERAREGHDGEPHPQELAAAASRVLDPFASNTRLSRRDGHRARRILGLQQRFAKPISGKRPPPLLLLCSDEFPEALDLFRLRSMAWGQGWELYEAWRALPQRAMRASPEERREAGTGRRRRSRSRRRRRR